MSVVLLPDIPWGGAHNFCLVLSVGECSALPMCRVWPGAAPSQTRLLSASPSRVQVLEACMKNCGRRFHNEVGKFRFLNELIKVVSPKVSQWQFPHF